MLQHAAKHVALQCSRAAQHAAHQCADDARRTDIRTRQIQALDRCPRTEPTLLEAVRGVLEAVAQRAVAQKYSLAKTMNLTMSSQRTFY